MKNNSFKSEPPAVDSQPLPALSRLTTWRTHQTDVKPSQLKIQWVCLTSHVSFLPLIYHLWLKSDQITCWHLSIWHRSQTEYHSVHITKQQNISLRAAWCKNWLWCASTMWILLYIAIQYSQLEYLWSPVKLVLFKKLESLHWDR